ncbi:hypothetical protein [Nonomuraea polychroma]|uniref:hypothetical protein n=1 Tax=Nonomuraea polychroma TaxID=46176 RepID=UPI000FDD0543|nr:hypothetical protein [Nonomuraea polychroma]
MERPVGFTHRVVFRRSTTCQERNIVPEADFACVFCRATLPAMWSVDPFDIGSRSSPLPDDRDEHHDLA